MARNWLAAGSTCPNSGFDYCYPGEFFRYLEMFPDKFESITSLTAGSV
jgi:hypothetical protein